MTVKNCFALSRRNKPDGADRESDGMNDDVLKYERGAGESKGGK